MINYASPTPTPFRVVAPNPKSQPLSFLPRAAERWTLIVASQNQSSFCLSCYCRRGLCACVFVTSFVVLRCPRVLCSCQLGLVWVLLCLPLCLPFLPGLLFHSRSTCWFPSCRFKNATRGMDSPSAVDQLVGGFPFAGCKMEESSLPVWARSEGSLNATAVIHSCFCGVARVASPWFF